MAQLFTMLHHRQTIIFRWTLLSIPLLDELITGFPLVGLPLLRDQLGLSYEQIGLLFSVAALSGMVTEPFINILSDRTSKRLWVIGGLLALAVSFALAGSTNSFIALLVAFAMMSSAGGAGVGQSEATLVDNRNHHRFAISIIQLDSALLAGCRLVARRSPVHIASTLPFQGRQK